MQHPPGITRDPADHAALEAAFDAMPPGYTPRTHLWEGDRPTFVNRLIGEASPYLQQHAHNPVDWWPWGDAALAEARARGVPIFLSAGYATCHWCHVMEEECFDDAEVAAALNARFVAVKLDREERPDIDQLYITATSMQQGHAGWPNSVWLTPDGEPFHTGTYFPKPQFMQTLAALANAWDQDRAGLEAFARDFAARLRSVIARAQPPQAMDGAPALALSQLAGAHNAAEGGFSHGTQFPHEGYVLWLLDHYQRTGDAVAFDMAARSLDAMVRGGLHDHVGGGFHRYTVDVNWRTPHFEKMLYNQAQMVEALTEALAIRPDPAWARAVARTVDYLARDMTAPEGAFFAAEDADSLDATGKRAEGAFYVWQREDAEALIGAEAAAALGLTAAPTLEEGAVVHIPDGADFDGDALAPALDRLFAAREGRPRPLRDEKIIAGWNGQMIASLALAGQVFNRAGWVARAARAFEACEALLGGVAGLRRSHCGGRPGPAANLGDYAAMALAATRLADATGDTGWVARAAAYAGAAHDRFTGDGGRYVLSVDAPLGPVPEIEDGAQPAGESLLLSAFAWLARVDGTGPWADRARALIEALSGVFAQMPVTRLDAFRAARAVLDGPAGAVRRSTTGGAAVWMCRPAGAVGVRLAEGRHVDPAGSRFEGVGDVPSAAFAGERRFPLIQSEGTATLVLQVCSGTECDLPETFHFRGAP